MSIFLLDSKRSFPLPFDNGIIELPYEGKVIESLEFQVKSNEDHNFIVYFSPMYLLTHGLGADIAVSTVLESLETSIKYVTDFCRLNHEKFSLVCLDNLDTKTLPQPLHEKLDDLFAWQKGLESSYDNVLIEIGQSFVFQTPSLAKAIEKMLSLSLVGEGTLKNKDKMQVVVDSYFEVLKKSGSTRKKNVDNKVKQTLKNINGSSNREELVIEGCQQERLKDQPNLGKFKKYIAQLEEELTKLRKKTSSLEMHIEILNRESDKVTVENELIIQQLHYLQELYEAELNTSERERSLNQLLNREIIDYKKQLIESNDNVIWLRGALKRARQRLWLKNRPFRNELKKQANLLVRAGEFDAENYLDRYPDTADFKADPVIHYLLHGAYEARNPSTEFNTLSYIYGYYDVRDSGMNPLVHFLKYGLKEGRKANPTKQLLPY